MFVKHNKSNKEQREKSKREKSKEMAERLWNEVTKKVRVYVLL